MPNRTTDESEHRNHFPLWGFNYLAPTVAPPSTYGPQTKAEVDMTSRQWSLCFGASLFACGKARGQVAFKYTCEGLCALSGCV